MNALDRYRIAYEPAICYSGFREGQVPGQSYPTYDQIKEVIENVS